MIKWFKKKKSKSQVDLDNHVEPFENPEEAMASPESEYVATPEAQESAPEPHVELPPQAAPFELEENGRADAVPAAPGDLAGLSSPETDSAKFEDEGDISPQRRPLFKRLRERLTRTRKVLGSNLDRLFLGHREIDLNLLDELEELLITADLGVETSLELIERTRDKVRRRELTMPDRLKAHLKNEMLDLLTQVREVETG